MQPTLINKTRSYTATGTVYTGGALTAATNATPIVITTTSAHNLVSGDSVQITAMTGNTAANGVFYVSVLSGTTFSLYTSPLLTSTYAVAGNGTLGGTPTISMAWPISSVIGDWSLKLRVDALAQAANCVIAYQDSVDGFVNDIRTIAAWGFTGAIYQFAATVSPQFTSTDCSRELRKYDLQSARFGVLNAALRINVMEYDAGAALILTGWYEN
jgi:hypothetical protein